MSTQVMGSVTVCEAMVSRTQTMQTTWPSVWRWYTHPTRLGTQEHRIVRILGR